MQSDNPNPTNESPPQNETQIKDDVQPSIWKFWTQRRYIVTFMLMLGCAIMFTLRINLSVAIISMTSNITDEHGNVTSEADFDWNSKEQGIVLSSFFYGSILTILPGGILSKRFNGAHLYGSAIGIASLLTLLTPFAARHLHTMIAIRVVQGLFLGITFPTQMALISKWAPVNERARITMLINSGLYFGTVIALQFSGVICDYMGWRYVFYIFGSVGLIWYFFFCILVKETPEKDKRISDQEKRLISSSISKYQVKRNFTIPWMAIFKSVPVWALIAATFTKYWLGYTMMMHMPMFLSQIMNIKMSKTGFLSCLPYLVNGISGSFSGLLADKLLTKGYLTVIQSRKLFTCVSYLIQFALLIALTFFMTPIPSMVILIIVVSCSAFAMTGFWINFIDIAPQFTGILFALASTIATISGIVAPTLTGFIVQEGTEEEWKIVFYISAAICLIGAIIYAIFAQGHIQPWAVIPENDENKISIEFEEKKLMLSEIKSENDNN